MLILIVPLLYQFKPYTLKLGSWCWLVVIFFVENGLSHEIVFLRSEKLYKLIIFLPWTLCVFHLFNYLCMHTTLKGISKTMLLNKKFEFYYWQYKPSTNLFELRFFVLSYFLQIFSFRACMLLSSSLSAFFDI